MILKSLVSKYLNNSSLIISAFYLVLIYLLFSCSQSPKKDNKLPYIGNYDLQYDTINGKEVIDTVYPRIPEFTFLNQDSIKVNSTSLKGKVWVADFFFTSCPTICPKMTAQLKRLSTKTKALSNEIQFISFTINPSFDTPSVLKAYKKRNGIIQKNWVFLTGKETYTHALGVDYFQVFANKDIASEGGYAHSPAFVLVDKKGYVRGVYVGTETDQVDKLEKDLRNLLYTEYNVIRAKNN